MRIRMWGVVCAVVLTLCSAAAQSDSDASWVGVWQGELDGQPSVILTLAEDTGALEGTLVLNGISRDGGKAHIAVRESHVLVHRLLEGPTLSFQVKRLDASSPSMDFTVTLKTGGNATIHCLNCGRDAPVVEIRKED
ncbi:MAG: hypothetical protein WBQ95_01620 [Terracidiphilus sp.]